MVLQIPMVRLLDDVFNGSYPWRGCSTRGEQRRLKLSSSSCLSTAFSLNSLAQLGTPLVWTGRLRGKLSTMRAEEKAVEIGSASLTGMRGRVAKSSRNRLRNEPALHANR